eukprot:136384-Pleurochrysis_carterae.AAC.2
MWGVDRPRSPVSSYDIDAERWDTVKCMHLGRPSATITCREIIMSARWLRACNIRNFTVDKIKRIFRNRCEAEEVQQATHGPHHAIQLLAAVAALLPLAGTGDQRHCVRGETSATAYVECSAA